MTAAAPPRPLLRPQQVAAQVLALGHRREHRVIRGLVRPVDDPQAPPGIRRHLRQHVPELSILHVVGTSVGRQQASRD